MQREPLSFHVHFHKFAYEFGACGLQNWPQIFFMMEKTLKKHSNMDHNLYNAA